MVFNHNKIKFSTGSDETFEIGKELASSIKAPCLIGLSGELGSGKTIFAKGFACGLDVKELVTSPTFLGISECYSGRMPFIHMDFYKKVASEEIINSYLKKGSIVLIEWAENFASVFNRELNFNMSVYIHYLKDKKENILDNERKIVINHIGS